MFRNYWKTAFRSLLSNKAFSAINIFGLAIGMAGAVLIFLWIQDEFRYDRFYPKQDRLYELMTNHTSDGKLQTMQPTPELMQPTIKRECPEVEDAARIEWTYTALFNFKEKGVKAYGGAADPGFLSMFDLPMLEGNPRTALNDPYSIVVTQDMARRLFGDEEAIGKTLRYNNNTNFTVTGVLKNLPENSQFNLEFINSYAFKMTKGYIDSDWTDVNNRSFVLLKQHATPASVNGRLYGMIAQYSHGKDTNTTAFLYPIGQLRLYSEFENGKPSGGRIETVRTFAIIAVFILLIACINFMNLSTASSERRAKEVGIRKVVGAGKRSLILQFLGESLLISAIAGILALLLVQWSLPSFGELTGKKLFIDYGSIYFWLSALGFVGLTGLLAGSYPVFFLSAFRPVTVLKGSFKKLNGIVTPRKVLVILQFSIVIVLIVSTLVIVKQVRYAQGRGTGYDQNNLIYVMIEGDIPAHYDAIKSDLLNSGAVTALAGTGSPLTQVWGWGTPSWEGSDPKANIQFIRTSTDGGIVQAAGLKLVQGRDIDLRNYPSDSTACLINEAALKATGFKDAIGQELFDDPVRWHVVGVVKDFILNSPYEAIQPLIIKGPKYYSSTLHIKMNPAHPTAENLATIGKIFKTYNPAFPFEYHFLDEEYAGKFANEQLTGKLAALFAGLTIFISCLGLFGLATYMAESRIKEVGIRKVLGASATRIAFLLSGSFLGLVLISIVVATPIAWYCMQHWLQRYTFRVNIDGWLFVLAGLGAILIALVTVSFQAVRAALANPVKSLRTV